MKKKVLIVDDDPVMKMSLESRLSEAGYEIEHVGNGREALDRVQGLDPDVILSDIVMPEVDGYELHKRLRGNPETADIPFIFLSVKSEPTDQLKGLQMGADDYVTKPFKLKNLISRMEKVMEKAARVRSFRSQAVFSGSLAQMDMGDVLQVVELNFKSGELVLRTVRGKKIGSAFFRDGRLVNATKDSLTGLEAFYDLVAEEDAFFEFFGREIEVSEVIDQSNMAVLLDGKLIIDEGRRLDRLLQNRDATLRRKDAPIPQKTRDGAEEWQLDKILGMVENGRTARRIVNAGAMSRHRAAGILADLIDAGVVEPAADRSVPGAARPSASAMDQSLLKGLRNIERRKLTGIMEIGDRPEKAAVYFETGDIVHAWRGATSSKKALFRIFSETGGVKRFQPRPVVVENTIDDSLDKLIMEWTEEHEWLSRFDADAFNQRIRVNPGMLEKTPGLKNRPALLNILSLVQQYGKIGGIIDASPLTDLKTYKCLLYLAKLKLLSIEAKPRAKTRIITDSTADLPPDIVRDRNIIVAPLSIAMDGKVYKDGVDIFPRDFYDLLANSDSFPVTSPLSVEECHKLFSDASPDSDILAIFISKKLSKTYENAVAAKSAHYDEYAAQREKRRGGVRRVRIEILNSELVSLSLGLLVLEAADKIEEGWPVDRARAHVEALIPMFRTFFLVNTLEYLKRGGRIGAFKAALGNFLGIKPILAIKNGEIVPAEQVRGGKKGQKRIEALVERELKLYRPDVPIRVGVMHGNAPKWADQMKEIIRARFNCESITVSDVGPTTGAHCGPGVVAVTILPLVDRNGDVETSPVLASDL